MTTSKPLNPFILLNDLSAAIGSIKATCKAKAAENSKPSNFCSTLLVPFSIFTSRRQLNYETLDVTPNQTISDIGIKIHKQSCRYTSEIHRDVYIARLM